MYAAGAVQSSFMALMSMAAGSLAFLNASIPSCPAILSLGYLSSISEAIDPLTPQCRSSLKSFFLSSVFTALSLHSVVSSLFILLAPTQLLPVIRVLAGGGWWALVYGASVVDVCSPASDFPA